jgi:hypothetical protein
VRGFALSGRALRQRAPRRLPTRFAPRFAAGAVALPGLAALRRLGARAVPGFDRPGFALAARRARAASARRRTRAMSTSPNGPCTPEIAASFMPCLRPMRSISRTFSHSIWRPTVKFSKRPSSASTMVSARQA